jgi:hypothetical protein
MTRYKVNIDLTRDDGSMTQDEVIAAIDALDNLSDDEFTALFHTQYKSDKNNPRK